MPWKEGCILDQRLQFLSSYQKDEMSVADLCRAYGISRPTAYRWINRYNETGPEGPVDRSRRPHTCSHATLEPMENAIFVLRAKHPSWGARKLKARLEMLQPELVWPAASTFGNILNVFDVNDPFHFLAMSRQVVVVEVGPDVHARPAQWKHVVVEVQQVWVVLVNKVARAIVEVLDIGYVGQCARGCLTLYIRCGSRPSHH